MEGRILAVDDDDINLKLVSAAVSRAGYEVFTAKNGQEALQVVEDIQPDVILLDVMMPELDGYEVCSRLRRMPSTAHIPIMLLTALDSVEEKIKGFDAGADDHLPKPFAPDELLARVKVLMRRTTPSRMGQASINGKVIAVYSLRGGMGVSTVAVNLSAGLAQLWVQPVVLVDLSMTAGQSALMFNLSFRHTWADLSQITVEEIDIDLVNDILLPHDSGTLILAASPRPEQNEYLTAEKVSKVISLLGKHYPYVVLDLPHDFHGNTLAGLDAAQEILTLLAPELASVRAMVSTLDVFETLEYPTDTIRVVLNWTFERKGLARKDIEIALKRPIDLVIPFSPEPIVSAINLGNPLVLAEPTSRMGSLFEDLALIVSEKSQQKVRPKYPSDTWKRVAQRMQKRLQKR